MVAVDRLALNPLSEVCDDRKGPKQDQRDEEEDSIDEDSASRPANTAQSERESDAILKPGCQRGELFQSVWKDGDGNPVTYRERQRQTVYKQIGIFDPHNPN